MGAEGIAADAGCRDNGSGWNAEDSTFTLDQSNGTIFLVGDSHAGAAADGVIAAGNSLGDDVAVWYRTSCPIQTRVPAILPDWAQQQDRPSAPSPTPALGCSSGRSFPSTRPTPGS